MFQGLHGRDVVGRFGGGEITSDAGGVLLRDVEQRTRILGRLSECFTDRRDPDRIEHSVEALIKQRVYGLCLGYEDLNDHDELCRDRLLALLCERGDLTGEFRRRESDQGKPLAGKSTLYRLERTPTKGPPGRNRKIMENRIKERQLGLFADRTSSKLMAANQLRLYLGELLERPRWTSLGPRSILVDSLVTRSTSQ